MVHVDTLDLCRSILWARYEYRLY